MKIKFIILVSILPMLLAGCFEHFDVYEFESASSKYEWGELGARFSGTKKKAFIFSEFSSPYELHIWFLLKENSIDSASITSVKISYPENGIEAYAASEIGRKKPEKEGTICMAFYTLKDIDLNFEDLKLTIDFEVEKNNKLVSESAMFLLEKSHRDYWCMVSH
jgi:hypothetical protein